MKDRYAIITHDRYEKIAKIYRKLRSSDIEPVRYVKEKLSHLEEITAAEVGAGAGRYSKLFFDILGKERLFLFCFDINEFMLTSLKEYLNEHNIVGFKTKLAAAEEIPLESNFLDCIFSFNSIHHFDHYRFFKESTRVLKNDGLLFVYTRTREQNAKNVWGKYFPLFKKKESRLFEPEEFSFKIEKATGLEIVDKKLFRFERKNTLDELVERVESRHYSTFTLYDIEEFDYAIKKFIDNLKKDFEDLENIQWVDEKIMYLIKKK